jgi:VanZ family protein
LRFWTFLGWCLAWLVVAWAMLDPAPPAIKAVSDKTIHFLSFVAVSFAAVAFCRSGKQLAVAGVFCAVAGVGFETAQYFIPARSFEWGDIAANLGGTATGSLLAALALGVLQRLGWPPTRRRVARSAA